MSDLPLVRELNPVPDPGACCAALSGWPHRLWLDSASDADRLGRYSFLMADPCAMVEATGRLVRHVTSEGTREVEGDALEVLRATLAMIRTPAAPGLPPFQGGFAGYIGYEFGATLERLPPSPPDDLGIPELAFGLYDWTLAWDHASGRAWLISTGIPEQGQAGRERAASRMESVLRRLEGVHSAPLGQFVAGDARTNGRKPDAIAPGPAEIESSAGAQRRSPPESSLPRACYLGVIQRVQEYILAGDIYQANITQRFTLPLTTSSWDLYIRLRTRNPAPFSAFLDRGDLVIASVSPERFLRLTSDGVAEARPIKGTRPRGTVPDEDARLAEELLASEKDRAEHVMIVDLMRNDLSRVCATGTVQVPELFALERYSTVHHLVSTIVGELAAGCDAIDLLRATFPGGSITGAPKIRAMEIIAELEPVRRDVYCGSIAYLSATGALDASIVIRTAIVRHGNVYCSAGGGIVADSDPESEYAESWDKARGLLEVIDAGLVVPASGE